MTEGTIQFQTEVLKAGVPVVVEFQAPWCGYCRRLDPVMDRLAEEWNGVVKVEKINIDEQPELAEHYGIDIIPTLLLFKQGRVGGPLVNPPSQTAILDWLKANGAL